STSGWADTPPLHNHTGYTRLSGTHAGLGSGSGPGSLPSFARQPLATPPSLRARGSGSASATTSGRSSRHASPMSSTGLGLGPSAAFGSGPGFEPAALGAGL